MREITLRIFVHIHAFVFYRRAADSQPFVYVSLKVGRVIVAVLGEVFNLTRRDIPGIPCRLY